LAIAAVASAAHHQVIGASVTGADIAWSVLTGVAGMVGVVLQFQGLAKGQMAVVAPVSAVTQAVVPFLFAVLAGEQHGIMAWLGVTVAIPALRLTVHRQRDQSRPGKALYGLGAGLALSVWFIAISQTSPQAGLWPVLALRGTGFILLSALLLVRRQAPTLPSNARSLALASGLYTLANFTYLAAVHIGPFGLVTVAASFYPAVTVLLALIVEREKMSLHRAMGLALSIASLILITSS
jgi:drug/metabolite transporter (DMT)-like permease